MGPRSLVWSEPEQLEAAAHEFAEVETILTTAEEICGPYVWGIYDLLVLPNSFPYGGMENPCLTFVTPTLLAGDRSLVDVVAHEAAHRLVDRGCAGTFLRGLCVLHFVEIGSCESCGGCHAPQWFPRGPFFAILGNRIYPT